MRLNFQAAFWPYLLLTITPLFWAGNFVTARALHEQIAPISLSYARWALVLLLIAPWALLRLWRARAELLGAFWVVLALSVLGVANFNTFIYTGLQTTSAQNALLLLAPLPLYIALVEWLLEGKLMRRTQALGLSLALVGMLVIVSSGQPSELFNLTFNRGDLWVLAALVSWSLYSVLLKRRPAQVSGFTLFAATVVLAVICLTPFFWWERAQVGGLPPLSGSLLLAISYMAVCASILAYLFWNAAVARVGALRASFFIYLQPLFGLLLAALFLGERLADYHLISALIIAFGIALANWPQRGRTF